MQAETKHRAPWTVVRASDLRRFSFAGVLSSRNILFVLAVALSVFVARNSLATLFGYAWNRDEYTHILVIIPVSLCLIFFERQNLTARPECSFVPGLVTLLIAATAALVAILAPAANPDARLALSICALVVCWFSFVLLFYGFEVFKTFRFALLFLFLLVPLPLTSVAAIVATLQTGSASATSVLFHLAGVPVFHVGQNLAIPGLDIEVARECSGIRSSIGLLVSCLILAHIFLRSTWAKLIFIALVVPFSVAKNAVRIFTLSMLGVHVDPAFLSGRLHHDGGFVFFILIFAVLWGVLRLLAHIENRLSPPLQSSLP